MNVSGCQGEIITCSALSSIRQRHRSFVPLKTQMKKQMKHEETLRFCFTHTSLLSESHSCCYLSHSLIHTRRKLCTFLRVKIIKSLCVILCKDDSFCSLGSNRLVLGKQEKLLITMSSVVAPAKQRKTRNGRKRDSLALLF